MVGLLPDQYDFRLRAFYYYKSSRRYPPTLLPISSPPGRIFIRFLVFQALREGSSSAFVSNPFMGTRPVLLFITSHSGESSDYFAYFNPRMNRLALYLYFKPFRSNPPALLLLISSPPKGIQRRYCLVETTSGGLVRLYCLLQVFQEDPPTLSLEEFSNAFAYCKLSRSNPPALSYFKPCRGNPTALMFISSPPG